MKSSMKLKNVLLILLIGLLTACNNVSNNNKDTDSEGLNQPIKSDSTENFTITNPVIQEGYFEIDKIINKGMTAFYHIDYDKDKIKIAIPAYSDSDIIDVVTSTVESTLIISINVPDKSEPFTHTAYFEVKIEDINSWDNFEIHIKSDAQPLSTQITERESLTQPPTNYGVDAENFVVETFEIPRHFYDYFKEDSLISIFTNDTLNQIEFFCFPFYEPDTNLIQLDSNENYLFINLIENGSTPMNSPKINYYTLTVVDGLNKKGKIKIIHNRKNRKTIARTPNRK